MFEVQTLKYRFLLYYSQTSNIVLIVKYDSNCCPFGFNRSLKLVKKLPEGYGLVLVGRQQTVGKGWFEC